MAGRKISKRRSGANTRGSGKKYYVLVQSGKDTDHVFTGSQPRRAALKAATRGYTKIHLRERGTGKIHKFKGSRRRVSAPDGSPSWLPKMVWRPSVQKEGIEKLDKRRK